MNLLAKDRVKDAEHCWGWKVRVGQLQPRYGSNVMFIEKPYFFLIPCHVGTYGSFLFIFELSFLENICRVFFFCTIVAMDSSLPYYFIIFKDMFCKRMQQTQWEFELGSSISIAFPVNVTPPAHQ